LMASRGAGSPTMTQVFGRDWIFRVTVGGRGLVAVGRDGGDAAVWVAATGD